MKKTGSFDEKDLKKRLECDPKKLLKNEVLMQDIGILERLFLVHFYSLPI